MGRPESKKLDDSLLSIAGKDNRLIGMNPFVREKRKVLRGFRKRLDSHCTLPDEDRSGWFL